jgi:putative nucleotidyltransferase with HDIG domain
VTQPTRALRGSGASVGGSLRWLEEGRGLEARGQLEEAAAAYQRAADAADRAGEAANGAEAVRRLGIIVHRRGDSRRATALCQRSLTLAEAAGDNGLAVESMNALATIDLDCGELDRAEATYRTALERAGAAVELTGRIEQNLGILANIRGDFVEARRRYQASLDSFLRCQNAKGCAIAYHNLGMIHADHAEWDLADWYYTLALGLARTIGDRYLQGLCLLNHSDVHVARRRFREATGDAEEALGVFRALDAKFDVAEARKQLGVIRREAGDLSGAEEPLVDALSLAVATGSALVEAETCRELALVYRQQNRNQETLQLLNRSYRLFRKLDARVDLVDVENRVRRLEETFLAVVRDWGQSIESTDRYTFGHCNRVAEYGVAVARAMALPEEDLVTIRLGAYLHDLGKVAVPEEILNKPGRLTPEELEIMQRHPLAGLELLEQVEFPWDLKPIIRWHHEKHDGSGYPDGLAGDEIPLHAQIICIVDVYDALTTTRSYRPALSKEDALRIVGESAHWWRPDVLAAFRSTMASESEDSAAPELAAAI